MSPARNETVEAILETADGSLLDLVDNLLNKGITHFVDEFARDCAYRDAQRRAALAVHLRAAGLPT